MSAHAAREGTMGGRFHEWLTEELEFERQHADGSGWGFAYNRFTVLVFGLGGAALIMLALAVLAWLVG